jgi:anti-anti-sigma factor
MEDAMDLAVEERNGVTLVHLAGRLDIAGASAIDLRFSALSGSRRALIVDLSNVSFLASMGIRLLLTGAKTVSAKGGRMVLLKPDAEVEKVLATAGIDTLIPIHADETSAMAAVKL